MRMKTVHRTQLHHQQGHQRVTSDLWQHSCQLLDQIGHNHAVQEGALLQCMGAQMKTKYILRLPLDMQCVTVQCGVALL